MVERGHRPWLALRQPRSRFAVDGISKPDWWCCQDPEGFLPEYVRVDPDTGTAVDYDGHDIRRGEEVFLEAKDGMRGLAFQPDNDYWMRRAERALDQATRQLAAMPEEAILEWHVSDPYGAAAVRDLFAANGLYEVTVIYTPRP